MVAAVMASDAADWPARPKKSKGRLTDQQRDSIDLLCQRRDSIAAALDLEASLLGSRATMEELVTQGDPASQLMAWQQTLLLPALAEAGLAVTKA